MDNNKKPSVVNEIINHCTGCKACAESCRILMEINEDPSSLALRGVTCNEAFSCALCGKCEAVCPLGLSPYRMFEQKRIAAVANQEMNVQEYCYLFPDRPENVMSIYRKYYGVDYSDLNLSIPADTAFLPGCSMMTYSPGLTRHVYARLAELFHNPILFTDCCGLPMYQIGLPARGDKIKEGIKEKANRLGVKKLVIACPNCYYQLLKIPGMQNIEILTVYEALKDFFKANQNSGIYTVHDSCPDRFEGVFASQVRSALDSVGCQLSEMKHHGKNSICCGSSGQMGHFRPEWSEEHERQVLFEAWESRANTLVAYCQACVLNFANASKGLKVRHVLNILLDFDEDYSEVKNKAAEIFAGPDATEIWIKLLVNPD